MRYSAALVVLVGLLATVSASRAWDSALNSMRIKSDNLQSVEWLRSVMSKVPLERRAEGHSASLTIKYKVPPSKFEDFVKEWQKVEDATYKQEDNVRVYDLKKTTGDNLYFWTYGEWDSMEDYLEHLTADYTKAFLNWVEDQDITWELWPLKDMEDSKEHKRVQHHHEDDDDYKDMPAHVLIEYHVPPSKVDDFVAEWNKAAEKTYDEEENTIYSLKQVATMNHHFVVYGTWKSFKAYLDHFESEHVKKLRSFAAENDIIWSLDALKKFGKQQEV